MLLKAIDKTWAPKRAMVDPKTHKITGFACGRWMPDMEPMEWPGALADAPDTLVATNPEDQARLDAVRAARDADLALQRREKVKDQLREQVRAEVLAEERARLKEQLRSEMGLSEAPPAEAIAAQVEALEQLAPVEKPKKKRVISAAHKAMLKANLEKARVARAAKRQVSLLRPPAEG